ncbi:hypothetical protein CYMTET_15244 [Cymbomonas tetramitiformis]|uniref:Kinesin light chain n=1 Tax=Cymbomonas tetramitiformis TaxID=36881 RepID=A0AAE0GEN8_9CHLO|nr:hypothetical protein CYMTET_15244 [Cymbomonas tetramitiformis]
MGAGHFCVMLSPWGCGLGIAFLHEMGRPLEALPLCERALDIFEKSVGPGHPDTAPALSNLGKLMKRLGKMETAVQLHARALAIFRKAHRNRDHPDVAEMAVALASLLDGEPREPGPLGEAWPDCIAVSVFSSSHVLPISNISANLCTFSR